METKVERGAECECSNKIWRYILTFDASEELIWDVCPYCRYIETSGVRMDLSGEACRELLIIEYEKVDKGKQADIMASILGSRVQ